MGGFANSALSLMLGWVRGASQWLWQLVSGEQGDSALAWISEHWLMLAIAVCVAGVVIDFMVYLARWRPDLVWRSFIRRVTKGRRYEMMEEELADQPADDASAAVLAEGAADAVQPEQPQGRERHRRSDKYGKGSRYEKIMKVKEILFPEEQEVTFQSYKPSKPLGQAEAEQEQNKPYIPPQWQKPGE